MNKIITKVIKNFVPPILMKFYKKHSKYGWFGDYKSWKQAKKNLKGYDSNIILKKVKDSLLKVKNGEAVYERDSVLFDKIQYSWPLLSGLMWIAAQNNGRLNVIDFGGSLGSTYYQNKKFLDELKEVKWNIVEQKKFVIEGRKHFQNKNLKFYYEIEESLSSKNINILILSGVLQYVEKPYELLKKIMNLNISFIIIDRTPFIKSFEDKITIQKVNPCIYEASYPCWFFSEERFRNFMIEQYNIIEEFNSLDKANISSVYKGIIFKRKSLVSDSE